MLAPPRHRIDAQPVYIDSDDSAWDHERIANEKAEDKAHQQEGQALDRHPFDVYQSGDTRYDLGAQIPYRGSFVKVTQYVDLAVAWQFVGKRMRHETVYACDAAIDRNKALGFALACKLALVRIEGPGAPAVDRADDACTPDTIERLFQVRAWLPAKVGEALYVASIPLRADEKKA